MSENEVGKLGDLLPLRLKDTKVGISLQFHNGDVMESIKLSDAMVYHVEWLTGEIINFKCATKCWRHWDSGHDVYK